MAYLVGYATNSEVEQLLDEGYDVHHGSNYNLVGEDGWTIVGTPPEGYEVVAIFTIHSVMEIINKVRGFEPRQ